MNPRFTLGWLDYAQARGFHTDPARVRHAKDKPRVERTVPYVRENFFRGETFVDLADAQRRVQTWCATTAGLRCTAPTRSARRSCSLPRKRPGCRRPRPGATTRTIFTTPKVARDHHVEVARGLYSVPGELIGQRVSVRADAALVKIFSGGQLVKTHPRVQAGSRSTDPGDYPPGRAEYALRDIATLTAKATAAGPAVGVYAARLLEVPLPWTRMRTVYRLLGLVRSYGPGAVDAACARALELDVVDLTKIARMLEQAREHAPAPAAASSGTGSGTGNVLGGPARFARDASEFEAGRR